MAITHVKVTYSVQPTTAQRVQELAIKWGVAKSEVIRRAVDGAANNEECSPRLTPRQALQKLKSTSSPYTKKEIRDWKIEIQLARRASDKKRDAVITRAWARTTNFSAPSQPRQGTKARVTK